MPHKMTRPEVVKRLGIKAMADARPCISYRDLARLFAASFSAVRDALRFPVSHWAAMLMVAPAPPVAKKQRGLIAIRPVSPVRARSGSRDRAKLVEPEPTVEYDEPIDFEETQPEYDEAAQERAIQEADEAQERLLRGVKSEKEDEN
nr:hypothetical protein [Candidatus Sigynarchaeota archaeon]